MLAMIFMVGSIVFRGSSTTYRTPKRSNRWPGRPGKRSLAILAQNVYAWPRMSIMRFNSILSLKSTIRLRLNTGLSIHSVSFSSLHKARCNFCNCVQREQNARKENVNHWLYSSGKIDGPIGTREVTRQILRERTKAMFHLNHCVGVNKWYWVKFRASKDIVSLKF
jgi:hypothetical protein